MNTEVMFSKKSDLWTTPQSLFETLNEEFHFDVDAAAQACNAKCDMYFGPDRLNPATQDALVIPDWSVYGHSFWLNPPYSMCSEFLAKVFEQTYVKSSGANVTYNPIDHVVCLLPARTDTRWMHNYIWDASEHKPYENVHLRFLKGRLKFGDQKNSAPFPSMIAIFS